MTRHKRSMMVSAENHKIAPIEISKEAIDMVVQNVSEFGITLTSKIEERLKEVSAVYLFSKEKRERASNAKNQRRILSQFIKACEDFTRIVQLLDDYEFSNLLMNDGSDSEAEIIEMIEDGVGRFRILEYIEAYKSLGQKAMQNFNKSRGRRRDNPKGDLIRNLAIIFKEATGRDPLSEVKFSSNAGVGSGDFFEFVTHTLTSLDEPPKNEESLYRFVKKTLQ